MESPSRQIDSRHAWRCQAVLQLFEDGFVPQFGATLRRRSAIGRKSLGFGREQLAAGKSNGKPRFSSIVQDRG
jgi:hypothetical protein